MTKSTSEISWYWKAFESLSTSEMYDIFALRIAVFVVEQDCPYQDADGKDKPAFHLFGMADNKMVAYSRILPPGVSYPEVSLGRVAIDPAFRGKGWGHLLMQETMQRIQSEFGKVPVKISAQEYLIAYYEHYNFQTQGKGYLEDDIPHIQMLYTP